MADPSNPTWAPLPSAPARPVAKTLLSATRPPAVPSPNASPMPTASLLPSPAAPPASFLQPQYQLPSFAAPAVSPLDRKSRSARADPGGQSSMALGSRSVRQPASPAAPSPMVSPLPPMSALSPKPAAGLGPGPALTSSAPAGGSPYFAPPPSPGRAPHAVEVRGKAETISFVQLPASVGGRERTMSIMGDIEKEKEDASHKKEGMMSKINKRGKSQERYFRLYGTSLSWTKTPTDKAPLGTIDLHAAQLELRAERSMFLLKATKKGKTKEYLLSCTHEELATQWIRAITAAQQRKSFQMGWMQRKKKAQWFLLADDTLLAFAKEQDPYSDYKRNVLDTVKLYECIIAPNLSDPLSFEVYDNKTKPPTAHSFTCKSEEEAKAWLGELKAVILKHTHRVIKQRSEKYGWLKKKGKKRYCVLSEGRLSWFAQPEDVTPRGTVQLDDYGVRPDAADILSFVLFCHTNPDLAFTFTTADVEDLGSWTGALQRAAERARAKRGMQIDEVRAAAVNAQAKVAKSGWALLKGKRRWLRMRDAVLMWLEEQPREEGGQAEAPAVHGSINLCDCSVYSESDFVWVMRARDGKEYAFQNQSKQEAADWVSSIGAALEQARGMAYAQSAGRAIDPRFQAMLQGEASRRGHVTHKQKQLRLELRPGELAVLRVNNKDQEALHRLIPLEGCSIALFAASSFVLTTPTKAWTFDSTADEAARWVESLALAIVRANEAVAKGLEQKGWLQYKGVYYWCALKTGRFYLFAEQMGFASIDDAKATKSFDVAACRIARSATDPLVFELSPPVGYDKERREAAGMVATPLQLLKEVKATSTSVVATVRGKERDAGPKRLLFRADTPQECTEWLEALVPPKVERRPQGPRVPIFGTELGELLRFERTQGQAGDVPFVVKRILEFLAPRAVATRSLFQGQVSFPKIREMQAQFNAGEDVNFLQYTVHDIGGLLKQFLRLLPEPLVPSRHFRSFLLYSENWRELRKLCADFPPAHGALLRYLFRFFASVQAHQDVGIVAMIFGPILLRAPDDAPEEDSALLRSVECVRTLVSAYREVWELSEEEVTRSVGADFDLMLRKLIEGKDAPAVVRARGQSEAGINSLDQLFSELQAERQGSSLGRSTLLSSASGFGPDGPAAGREMLRAMIANNKEHVRALEQMARDGRVVQTGIESLDELLAEMKEEKKTELTQRKTHASAAPSHADASLFAIGAGIRRAAAHTKAEPEPEAPASDGSALSEFDDLLGELNEERAMRPAPPPPFAAPADDAAPGRTRTATALQKPQLSSSGHHVLDAPEPEPRSRGRTATAVPVAFLPSAPLPSLPSAAPGLSPRAVSPAPVSPRGPSAVSPRAPSPLPVRLSPRGEPPQLSPRGEPPQLSPREAAAAAVAAAEESEAVEALRAKQEARKKRAAAIAAQRAEAEQRLKLLENQLEQLKSDMAVPGAAPPAAPAKPGVYSAEIEDLLADI